MISIIIRVYNEAESLPDLLPNIHVTVRTYGYVVEVILINDGSTDATADVLSTLAAESPLHVHIIHFKHNRGKAEVLTAGFQKPPAKLLSPWTQISKTIRQK